MLAVDIDIRGELELLQKLDGFEDRMRRLAVPMGITADLLERHVAKTYATAGGHIGAPWPGLRPRTVLARGNRWGYYRRPPRQAGAVGPVLTWTRRLRNSFLQGNRGHVRQATDNGLRWGSRVPYGQYHQRGSGRLPQRKILGFASSQQRREIVARPTLLWVQGVPPGAIRTVVAARAGL